MGEGMDDPMVTPDPVGALSDKLFYIVHKLTHFRHWNGAALGWVRVHELLPELDAALAEQQAAITAIRQEMRECLRPTPKGFLTYRAESQIAKWLAALDALQPQENTDATRVDGRS